MGCKCAQGIDRHDRDSQDRNRQDSKRRDKDRVPTIIIDPTDSKKFRWFWNNSNDPWDKANKNHTWAQYPLEVSDQIEQAYLTQKPQFQFDVLVIQFDYITFHQHVQINANDQWKKRPVIREMPNRLPSMIQIDRVELTQSERIIPYENNQIEDLKIFCYSQLFDQIRVDKSHRIVREFTSHLTLLDNKIIKLLSTEYVDYLKEYHNLTNEIFSFEKLKEILKKDLKHHTLKGSLESYVNYYINDLSENNFNETIVRMYIEEGSLYRNLNKVFRSMSLAGHSEYIFYLLCLLFVYRSREESISKDVTVYRGTTLTNEVYTKCKSDTYQVNNVIINYDFTSTSKNKDVALSFLTNGKNPNKILFEILLEKESSEHPYLNFKPFDLDKVNQYGEKEVLLPPNGIFEVTEIIRDNQEDYDIIRMNYRTNLFEDCLQFISTETQIKTNLGIYNYNDGIDSKEFNQVISLTVDNAQTEEWASLDKFQNLRELEVQFTGNQALGMIECTKHFHVLNNLQKLNLSGNQFGFTGIKVFSQNASYLENLQNLNVSNNDFGYFGMEMMAPHFKELRHLIFLNISGNNVGFAGIRLFAEEFSQLENLQVLDISSNRMENKGTKIFSEKVIVLKNLQNLNISRNQIEDGVLEDLADALFKLPHLEILNIGKNRLNNAGVIELFANLKDAISWKCLNLENNNLQDSALGTISQSFHLLPNLHELILRNNLFGSGAFNECVDNFPKLSSLTYLDLGRNYLENEGIRNLSAILPRFRYLTKLNVEYNLIEEVGMKEFIRELRNIPNISEVYLTQNSKEGEYSRYFDGEWKYLDRKYLKSTAFACKKELLFSQFIQKAKFYSKPEVRFRNINLNLLQNLDYYQNVSSINLSGNFIGDAGIAAFSANLEHFHNLTHINLELNGITAAGIKALSLKLPALANHLTILNLGNNRIKEAGMVPLVQCLNQMTNLVVLNISNNAIEKGFDEFCRNIKQLNKLEELIIRENYIMEKQFMDFSQIFKNFPNLRTLNLSKNNLGKLTKLYYKQKDGQQANVDEEEMDSVEEMDSDEEKEKGNEIEDENENKNENGKENWDVLKEQNEKEQESPIMQQQYLIDRFFLALRCFPQLENLNLEMTQLGTRGSMCFSRKLRHLPCLKYLNLSKNSIEEYGIRVFAKKLKHIPNLEVLSLERNLIGNQGARILAKHFHLLPNLKELNLRINRIEGCGVDSLTTHFHELTNLTELSLDITRDVNSEEIKALTISLTKLPHFKKWFVGANLLRVFQLEIINQNCQNIFIQ